MKVKLHPRAEEELRAATDAPPQPAAEPGRQAFGEKTMNLQAFYPIIVTPHLEECRDFYRRWFGFEVVFEASWFVLLGARRGVSANLAFMHPDHPSAPPGPEAFPGKGMCLEFQVPDARVEHERFVGDGAVVSLSLRDEPFGQRRFGLFDPAGVWIDVVEQIDPAAGWWDKYIVAEPEA